MQVTPNEVVRGMTANGANVLPNSVVQSAFGGMFGKTLNFVNLKQAIGKLDQWYSDHGVLGQVRTLVWTRGCVDMHGSCILYMIASPNEVLVSYKTFICSCRVLIRLALAYPTPCPAPPQVVDFSSKDGQLRVDCAEAMVGKIDLHFIDPKTQKPREKPRTRPEVGPGPDPTWWVGTQGGACREKPRTRSKVGL